MVIDNCFRTPKNRVRHLVLPEYRFLTASEYVCTLYFFLSSHFINASTKSLGFYGLSEYVDYKYVLYINT